MSLTLAEEKSAQQHVAQLIEKTKNFKEVSHIASLIGSSVKHQKIGLSEERLEPLKKYIRDYISYWREYPDMFVDFLQTGGRDDIEPGIKFYFYQRVFLRVAIRYKYVYMVFPRAYSKSFLSVMTLMIKCILFPRSKLFVTSGGKEQAAGIIKEKVEEICALIPAFENELDLRPGKTRQSKDYCIFMFKNGSYFDNIAAKESSRGKRRHGKNFFMTLPWTFLYSIIY